MLTTFELDEYVFGALRAGASGFLLKDIEPADLLTPCASSPRGEALLAPAVTRRLIEAFVGAAGAPPRPDGRARRAHARASARCSALVGAGLTNAEIAERARAVSR